MSKVNLPANFSTGVRIPYSEAPAVRVAVFGETLHCSTQLSLRQLPGRSSRGLLGTLKDVTSDCVSTEPGYVVLRNVPPGVLASWRALEGLQ